MKGASLKSPWFRRVLWLLCLWAAGVASLAVVAAALEWVLVLAGMPH